MLLDEGQILYDVAKLRSTALFQKLKLLSTGLQGERAGAKPLLRVGFVATYGASPSGFDGDTMMVFPLALYAFFLA